MLLLCFLPCCLLFPSISTTEQDSEVAIPALSRQTNRERSSAECYILAEMWARDEISPVSAEACLCAVHVEQHWLMVKGIIDSLLARIPEGIPSHLTHAQCCWHSVACPALLIYLIYLYFVWKRLICFSSQTQVFLSAPARSWSHVPQKPLWRKGQPTCLEWQDVG